MKKVHLLPNVVTAFGLSCGLFVIFKMCMITPENVNNHILVQTAGILLLAVLADLLDGAIARAMKAESDFGSFFDSLADGITFGVCPSVIILKTLNSNPDSELSFLLMMAALVYSVCGVLRLVRFSVQAQLAKGDEELNIAHKKNFTGLPIPAAAGAAVSGNLFLYSKQFFDAETTTWLLFSMLILLGYLMVSRWKFPSLKTLHLRVASFQLVVFTVVVAVVIFYGILHHFALIFFAASWGYIVLALILSGVRLVSGKRSKTLEDFEPESDE